MIETAHIDIKAVIEQLCCIEWKCESGQGEKAAYKGGPCPFCHVGNDRFAVFTRGEKPHFYCGIHGNGCEKGGDVIKFVQLIKGYSTSGPAIRDLREMGFPVGDENVFCYTPPSERGKPCKLWQDQGNAVVHAAQKYLWSPVGKQVLDYLHKRGLTDETIKRFRLGYWPKWVEHNLVDWGLEEEKNGKFWIRPGIIIPWYEGATLWKINMRITEHTPKERERMAQGEELPRYKVVKGSGNGLFNVDSLQSDAPAFMTEGEFCAMTIAQETDYVAVATGSTKGAQLSRWIAALSLTSHLVIAFDSDQGKGEKAAEYWIDLFEDRAMFYPPWSKDVNNMLQQGQDVKLWSSMGIELVSPVTNVDPPPQKSAGLRKPALFEREPVLPGSEQNQAPTRDLPHEVLELFKLPDTLPDLQDVCTVCGGDIESYGDDGQAYCAEHLPALTIPTPCTNPGQSTRDPLTHPVVQAVIQQFNASVEIIPTSDVSRRKVEIAEQYQRPCTMHNPCIMCQTFLQEYREWRKKPPTTKRAPIWQYIADCTERGEKPDYWVINRMKREAML